MEKFIKKLDNFVYDLLILGQNSTIISQLILYNDYSKKIMEVQVMKKLYNWVKMNKMVSGVAISVILLIVLNLILMAQFVNILNSFI